MSKLTTGKLAQMLRDRLTEHDAGIQGCVYIIPEDEIAELALSIVNDLDDEEDVQ